MMKHSSHLAHKNEHGTTLIETMIGASLMMIGIMAMTGVMTGMSKSSSQAKLKIGDSKQVQSLAESIRKDIGSYQIDFEHPVTMSQSESNAAIINKVLVPTKLAMAWDNNSIYPAHECPSCPGRYGFLIQPFQSSPGLYLVTVRRTHRDWKVSYKDFQFIVGTR